MKLGWILLGGALLYAAVALALFLGQRSLFYPASADGAAAVDRVGAQFQRIRLRTADGLDLVAAYRPPRAGKRTVVFFHGNGDSLDGAREATARLAARGYGAQLSEYRGYAGNPGQPSEDGLYHDGRAALAWLAGQGIGADDVVLVGNSLGSGVATQLASEHAVSALVLVSPFTSLTDVASEAVRGLVPRFLIRDRYDNLMKLPSVDAPVLLLHGDQDRVIPVEHSRRLASTRPTTLVIVPGRGHELAYVPDTQDRIADWLDLR